MPNFYSEIRFYNLGKEYRCYGQEFEKLQDGVDFAEKHSQKIDVYIYGVKGLRYVKEYGKDGYYVLFDKAESNDPK